MGVYIQMCRAAFEDWMLVLFDERQAHVLANLLCGELRNRRLILKTIFIREVNLMFV